MDKVDKLILNGRLAKLTLVLDEAIYRTKDNTRLWRILSDMKIILAEEYNTFKENYEDT